MLVPQRQYGIRRLLGGVAWIGASGLFGRSISFAASIILAHALGPAEFGVLAFGLSVAMIFSVCVSFGLDEVLVREMARYPRNCGPLFADALTLRLGAIPVGLAGAVALALTGRVDARLGAGLAAYAILNSYLLAACAAFRSRGRMHAQAFLMGGQILLIGLLTVAAAWLTGRVDVVAAAYVAATSCAVIIAYAILQRTEARPRFAWRPAAWNRLARTSAPFALAAIGLLGLDRLALVAIALVAGPEAAGWFGAVHTVVLALAGLATIATMVAFPLLSRAAVRDPHQAAVLVADLLRVALVTGLVSSAALYLLAPVGVPILFGTDYAPSIAIMQLIALSVPAVFVTMVLIGAFEATDRQTTSARCIAAALPVAAAMCLGATWWWGVTGGAAAYSISHMLLASLLAARWFLRQRALPQAALGQL